MQVAPSKPTSNALIYRLKQCPFLCCIFVIVIRPTLWLRRLSSMDLPVRSRSRLEGVEALNRLTIPVTMHVPQGLAPKRAGAVFFRSQHSILIHTAN